jgi:hypothetical protein
LSQFLFPRNAGGAVHSSKRKTKLIAHLSVERFLWRHPECYYWTFTVAELVTDKAEAMKRAKPLRDLIARRTGITLVVGEERGHTKLTRTQGEYLGFWELQKRGAWHLHLLTSVFFDVNFLRPWMVARGWGPIMRVEKVRVSNCWKGSDPSVLGVAGVANSGHRLARYLTKYLTKTFSKEAEHEEPLRGKKAFCASAVAKIGTVGFSWTPDTEPTAYLYYWGKRLFIQLYGRWPTFREFRLCVRLGYEDLQWWNFDPFMEPP